MALCVSVAIDDIVNKIDKLYDYYVPLQFCDVVCPGVRVVVPFSKSNMLKKAIVLEVKDVCDGLELKSVVGVADSEPVVNNIQIDLINILKSRYYITYSKAFKSIVPRSIDFKINQKFFAMPTLESKNAEVFELFANASNGLTLDKIPPKLFSTFKEALSSGDITKDVSIKQKGRHTEKTLKLKIDKDLLECKIAELDKRFERQRDLMSLFLDFDEISLRDALYYSGCSDSTVKTLQKKDIIEVIEKPIINSPYTSIERKEDTTPICLSEEQQKVYDSIYSDFNEYHTHLLYGVTGSGKTLVYMSLIDSAVKNGKSVIFMVPEISLTPQTLSRFYTRYGEKVSVIHSGLTPGERADEWMKIKKSECSVIVGTRSAVFSPVNNLGLVIIDEEHEPSYKSETSPKYHARDISRYICHKLGIPLVIGSATPSVESFYLARKGVYRLHRLCKRFNNNALPETKIIDMSDSVRQGEQSFLSEQLQDAISDTLENGQQAILFLNRRGANTVVGCRSCGYVAKCPNCGISLTYHLANNRCMCHYCGYNIKQFDECPECESKHIKKLGIGTQLVFSELEKFFPQAKILRMDFDTISSYISYGEKLSAFKKGEYDIMLGTQMVAKGLDFPNVTLVGVINADLSLYVDDFRAGERTFSLLTQVCGRSGRAGKEGTAYIQTYAPDNSIIQYAKMQDYDMYFGYEIKFRKALNYPPFCDIVRFTVSSKKESQAYSDVMKLYDKINLLSKTDFKDIPVRLLNPTMPKIAKFNEKYRYNLIVKSRISKRFYEMIDYIQDNFSEDSFSELSINVNPLGNV